MRMSSSKWFKSIMEVDLDTIEQYIKNGFNVNTLDSAYRNGLFWISAIPKSKCKASLKIAKMLVSAGIDVNQLDLFEENCMFKQEIIRDTPEVIHYLIDKGANPHIISENNTTVLTESIREGQSTLVDRLITLGLDINQVNFLNLHIAEEAMESKDVKKKKQILRQLERYFDKLNDIQKAIVEKEKLRLLF